MRYLVAAVVAVVLQSGWVSAEEVQILIHTRYGTVIRADEVRENEVPGVMLYDVRGQAQGIAASDVVKIVRPTPKPEPTPVDYSKVDSASFSMKPDICRLPNVGEPEAMVKAALMCRGLSPDVAFVTRQGMSMTAYRLIAPGKATITWYVLNGSVYEIQGASLAGR